MTAKSVAQRRHKGFVRKIESLSFFMEEIKKINLVPRFGSSVKQR